VVVVLWLEVVILPVVVEKSMVVSLSFSLVVVISMVSLEVVWAGMCVKVWDLVVLIDDMGVSMSIVMVIDVLWLVMGPVVSSIVSTVVVLVSTPMTVMVVHWGEVGVIMV
jgi:hypothetical protein